MILTILKKHWLEIGLIIALSALQIGYLLKTREAAQYRAERDTARALVVTMGDQIEHQNAGIRALIESAQQNREVYLAGLKAAGKQAARLNTEAAEILALPAPTNPDEACTAAAGVLEGVTQ